jgi:hypothetical protein
VTWIFLFTKFRFFGLAFGSSTFNIDLKYYHLFELVLGFLDIFNHEPIF